MKRLPAPGHLTFDQKIEIVEKEFKDDQRRQRLKKSLYESVNNARYCSICKCVLETQRMVGIETCFSCKGKIASQVGLDSDEQVAVRTRLPSTHIDRNVQRTIDTTARLITDKGDSDADKG